MISYADALKSNEKIFTHQDNDTGKQTVIAVERLIAYLKEQDTEVVKVLLDYEYGFWLPNARGMEPHRIKSLLLVTSLEPVVFCKQEDDKDSSVLVDGTHRYFTSCLNQSTYIPAYVVPRAVWEEFVIDAPRIDMDLILALPSGIEAES